MHTITAAQLAELDVEALRSLDVSEFVAAADVDPLLFRDRYSSPRPPPLKLPTYYTSVVGYDLSADTGDQKRPGDGSGVWPCPSRAN